MSLFRWKWCSEGTSSKIVTLPYISKADKIREFRIEQTQKKELTCVNSSLQFIQLCDSGRIQTCNLLIRSQMLYSVELRSQKLLKRCFLKADAKVRNIFESTKFILYFFKNFLALQPVGMTGLEPATSRPPDACANQLRYIPCFCKAVQR